MLPYIQKTKERKIKVLVIDQNSVQHTARSKWDTLAKCENIQLNLVTPKYWKENYNKIYFQTPKKMEYKIFTGSVIWPGFENRSFFLTGLIKAMREFKPDLIFLFEEPFSFFALQTILLKKIICPKTKLIFYTWDNLTWENNYPYRPSFVYEMTNKIVLKSCDGGIGANIEASEILRKKGFTKPVEVIYYPLDLNLFSTRTHNSDVRNRYSLSLKGIVIGYIGRLLEQKGIGLLLEACARIQDPITLLIIGDGPEKQKFQELATSLDLQCKIRWINTVHHHEIPELFQMIDILVLPSYTTKKWKEQFGRVLVEAMACGVVPIGSSSGAIPEVIGDAGLIFSENETVELERQLLRLIRDPQLREELGKKALARSNLFSNKTFANHCHAFIMKILNNTIISTE